MGSMLKKRTFSRVAAALLLAATVTTPVGAPRGATAQVRVPGPVVIVPPPPPPPEWLRLQPIYVPCTTTGTCPDLTRPDRNLPLGPALPAGGLK